MSVWNHLACRFWHPRDYWHNRHFDGRYQAELRAPGDWSVRWRGKPVATQSLGALERLPHGEVCHIIASGPSLAELREPARLFNDFTICLNGSFRVAQQVGRPCDLFVTFDAGFIRRRFGDFQAAVPWSKHFLLDHLMFYLIHRQNQMLASQLNPFLYDDANRPFRARSKERTAQLAREFRLGGDFLVNPADGRAWMSRSASVGLVSGASVVCLALQAAWLMRFREVRIYGMDLGGPGRFYAERGKREPMRLATDFEDLRHWFAAFAASYCGPEFRVFNCSSTSRLPVEILPRRDANAP